MSPEEAVIELMWRKRYNMGFPTKLFHRKLSNFRFPNDEVYDDIGSMYKLLANAEKIAYHGLPKYIVHRHSHNNSAWTTKHELLTPETLGEYLQSYRAKTEWLSKRFPEKAAAFQYFEWSFMISMVEKVTRLNIPNCQLLLENMRQELQKHRKEFLGAPEIQTYEKEWMNRYILME